MRTLQASRPPLSVAGEPQGGAGPVLLATLGDPPDPAAMRVAVDAAVEAGRRLVRAHRVGPPPLPLSVPLGYDQLEAAPETAETLAASAELARSLGVRVERLRVRSPRPVAALLEIAGELRPGLLVFGPDSGSLSRRGRRTAARAITDHVSCLVW